ncbi:MAG: MFS transporter [Alicyclobacillaceae bacterium]|nr:MFS transporter [Alicyclobacillaceae bacterium]
MPVAVTQDSPADARAGWRVLSVTSLGVLLVLVNMGTLNVGLPAVASYFHANPEQARWILLAYMVVNTVLILVFGQFADIFGRRRLYLAGLAAFTLMSLMTGMAPNVNTLIVMRALQAAGGAMVITNTTALITDAFPPQRLGQALGINVLVASAAQLLGPVVGGFLAVHAGWRWIFWFNVPFGLMGLAWGWMQLKPSAPAVRAPGERVDLLGGLWAFLALGGLITALSPGSQGLLPAIGWVSFAVFLPVFWLWERRASSPLLDLGLFHDRAYTMANVATFLNSFARSSLALLMGLFFQCVNRQDAFHAGMDVLPVTFGMLVSSPLAGRLTTRIPARVIATAGLVLVLAGLMVVWTGLRPGVAIAWMAAGLFLTGFGSGTFLTPNTTAIMTRVPPNRRGIANGLRSMLNNMGQALSAAATLWAVSLPLPARLKGAVYAGSAAHLRDGDAAVLIFGFRAAVALLMAATVLGIAASLLRGHPTAGQPDSQ